MWGRLFDEAVPREVESRPDPGTWPLIRAVQIAFDLLQDFDEQEFRGEIEEA